MADFSKFKVGSTSYNVKDAAAGKSLSLSGKDLSLKNAAGTAISTVTLPDDTIYTVSLVYTDSTVSGQVNDLYSIMKAGNGAWSLRVSPALPAGTLLSSVNKMFIGLIELPNATPSTTRIGPDFPGTAGVLPMAYFLVPDSVNAGTHYGGIVTLCVADQNNGTIWDWGYTDLGGGGSSSAITSANIYCGNASLWNVASTQPVTIQVDEVIIDGHVGLQLTLAELIQIIINKFSTAPGTDLKISITGQDWSAEVLSYSINSGTVTIYFEVFAGSQMYKRYASFNSSSPTSLSLVQAQ